MTRKIALLSLLVALILPSAASALPPLTPDSDWVPNGPVNALAADGQTLYLGGSFTHLSKRTGGGVVLDPGTGAPTKAWPEFAGQVEEAIPDGAGGFYVVGDFTSVGGVPRGRVARIRADGTLDPAFVPPVFDERVHDAALAGGGLVVGGQFQHAGGVVRRELAKLHPATGALDPTFDATVTGYNDHVLALEPSADGTKVFVGGGFTCIGRIAAVEACTAPNASPRHFAALIDATTGVPDPAWKPDPGHDVRDIVRDGSTVWLGGGFRCLQDPDVSCATVDAGQDKRGGIAAVSAANGDPLPSFTTGVAGGWVSDFDLTGGALTVVGSFDCVSPAAALDDDCSDGADVARGGAARLTTAGTIASWNPNAAGGTAIVQGVARMGDAVWLAGTFTSLRGVGREGVGAVDFATGNLLPAAPKPDEAPGSVGVVDGKILLGGPFGGFDGLERRGLAAIDLQTGQPTAFAPDAESEVSDLAVQDGTLFVAGWFSELGGASRSGAGAIDLGTATVTGFDPQIKGSVSAIAPAGDLVVVGGSFDALPGDADQSGVAAVRADTGVAVPGFPELESSSDEVREILVSGGVAYVGGDFGGPVAFGGLPRDGAGAVDLATLKVTAWSPSVGGGSVEALAETPGGIALGGGFSTVGGTAASSLAVVDRASGALRPGFAHGVPGTGTVRSLSSDGRHLAVGGFDLAAGPVERGLLLVDAASGAQTGWKPAVDSLEAVLLRDGALSLGGWHVAFEGLAQSHLAILTPAAKNLERPSVVGAVSGGATVTCAPGRWEGNPLLTRTWLLDGKVVAGATSETLTLPAQGAAPVDVSCRVHGRSIRGEDVAEATPVVLPALPTTTTTTTVDPPATPAPPAPPVATPRSADRTAPVLASLRAKGPRRIRATWRLSEAARVTVTVERRKGKRWARVGARSVASKPGATALRLPARFGRRALSPGRYRLRVVAVDAAGNRSAERRVTVRLTRAGR